MNCKNCKYSKHIPASNIISVYDDLAAVIPLKNMYDDICTIGTNVSWTIHSKEIIECDCYTPIDKLENNQKITNGDRIRKMNNDELAKFLYFINNACSGHDCSMCPFVDSDDCDIEGFKEWLDKEAEK